MGRYVRSQKKFTKLGYHGITKTSMSEEILRKIQFHDDHKERSFEYDSASGFLRDEMGSYLLFRAEAPGDVPSLRSLGDLDADKTLSYGKALYTGNTPESVAPYTWTRPDNVINAYITPELNEEHIFNHAQLSRIDAAKEFYSMSKQRKELGWHAVSRSFDQAHGDALLATIDAGFDISAGQTLLSSTNHTIKPRWGLWRGELVELTRVGSAYADSQPYRWAVKLARKQSK